MKRFLSSLFTITILRPLFGASIVILAFLGMWLVSTGGTIQKIIGLSIMLIPIILGLIFSYLAFFNKLGYLNDFWQDIIFYYYRGIKPVRLMKASLALVFSLGLLYFWFIIVIKDF